nr:hypothetical protein [Tanacetum cinerariifolium]
MPPETIHQTVVENWRFHYEDLLFLRGKEFIAEFGNKILPKESLIAPSVSESTQDEGVLEDESEYTDDHNEEVEVSEDNEKEIAAAQNDEMKTTARVQDKVRTKGRGVISEDKDDKGVKLKFRRGKVLEIHQSENNDSKNGHKDDKGVKLKFIRGKVLEIHQSENNDSKNGRKSVFLKHQGEQERKDAHGLWNNITEETTSKLAKSRKSKVKALVGAFETMIYLSKTANPLPCNVTNIQVWRLSDLQMKTCEYSLVLVLWCGTMLAILFCILCLFS